MLKKELIRVLLSLLIGSQSFNSSVSTVEQAMSIVSSTTLAELEDAGYLQAVGINYDTVNPSYLELIYAEAQNETLALLKENPTVYQAVETIIDSETGAISIEPITAETIGEVEYVEGGFVGACTTTAFVASLLADWGLNMYGNWQYDNDAQFRSDYNDLVKTRTLNFASGVYAFKEMYGDTEDGLARWIAYCTNSQSSRSIGSTLPADPYGIRTYLTEEDAIRVWNGEGISDFDKYCNPNKISSTSIWRIWADEAKQYYANGISQFFNKKEVEKIAENVYEQGIDDSYDITYDDISAGETVQAKFTFNGAIATQVAHMYNSYKHSQYQPAISSSVLEEAILRLQPTSQDNFIYVQINGDTEKVGDISSGDTILTMYVGVANSTPITTYNEITELGNRTEYNVNGNFRRIMYTAPYNGSSYFHTIDRNLSRIDNIPLGIVTMPFTVVSQYLVSKLKYAGACGFVNEIVENEKSSLFDWLTSNPKFPSLYELKDYINKLPSFKTRHVLPDGTEIEEDWVKVPFLKKIKNAINEHYDENDLLEDVDLTDEAEELPDYIEDEIIAHEDKDSIKERRNEYSEQETPEATKPSPSDNVIPPIGTNPSPKPTRPVGGGTPVVIPPIIPVGGSSSALFSVYNPTASEIDSLGSYLWGSSIVELLSKFLQNPIDAIITLHQIYITPTISGRKNIKLGYLDSGVASDCVSQQYESLDCGTVFVPEYYTDARDYSPWTQVQIYLPFIGIVPLSTEDIIESMVNVKYGIDVYTGSILCTIKVTKSDGTEQTLYTYEGNGSVQYPLTGGNMNGIIKGSAGLLTGAMLGGLSGAVVGGITGALSGGATVSRSSGFGGNAGAMACKKPYLIINRKVPDDAFNYPAFYGLPANINTSLIYCKGYTRVKDVNLDSIRATEKEKQEIDTLLKQGILV